MPMRTAAIVSLVLAVWGSSCALRPRYGDFVGTAAEGDSITLVLKDGRTGMPVEAAQVEWGELRSKVTVRTAADGKVVLPVVKKQREENPVLVVSLPKGVTHYRLDPWVAPLEASVDAGVGEP